MTVKELRQKTNLSQRQFADMFHVSVSNIQHWEQGVSTPPDYVLFMMEQILNNDNCSFNMDMHDRKIFETAIDTFEENLKCGELKHYHSIIHSVALATKVNFNKTK